MAMQLEQHRRTDSAHGILHHNSKPNEAFLSTSGAAKQSSQAFLLSGYDEEQVRLMEESCIVVDANDNPLGAASKKDCHLMTKINDGLLHRAFSVFLFDSENRLLLQRRASEKITFPDMWTNTCCSHPLSVAAEQGDGMTLSSAVQGAKCAAVRKLLQELGIPTSSLELDSIKFLGRIHYKAASDGLWGEHEIDYILFVKADVTIDANPNEVRDWKYVTMSELESAMNDENAQSLFTPWFRLICDDTLFQWWKLLQEDRLDELRGPSEIRRLGSRTPWEPTWPRRGTLRRGEDY
ncbi:Isopentenyl-diphosphate Delta-isomerase [Cercospora beticola]|uniref:isopentenyl-diphosphate Delta-isomerase n=1 Tax=Cercospora beticola TaxID=122368 RepID=A0A2G5I1S6_CERBT|nr:Isopentenyl-diphosphate Delta-isomerase [Cercospora beticola]PIA98747.1 Isopentenyl-diphosphate Delta-isomerase [Cercospora beticola]WPA99473.1 hypothetical protein RHO25_004090 [Cercospora beticola]